MSVADHQAAARTALRTLGRSGLVVSPLALGTMTFGTAQWGSPDDVCADIFDAYVDAGGNFVDTADVYADGRSEELVGAAIAARDLRDRIVLATKYTFHAGDPSNANAGGNGRKNMYRALEGSLRRLRTDYIDLYWMHAWDRVTPVEETLQSLGDLVRAGKIRYFGFSDVPAWYAAKAATLAAAHAIPGPIALQLSYSLAERNIEREHIPAAQECGLGLCAWSPLSSGFLTGKYQRAGDDSAGAGRLATQKYFLQLDDKKWVILERLRAIAAEIGRPPAQVALAWAAGRPGMTSLILGASTLAQLHDNMASLEIALSPEQAASLDAISAPEALFPYPLFDDEINRENIFGGATVVRPR